MIIYVDIDNTVFKTKGTNYEESVPMPRRIEKINNLYDNGNTIVYWTARGTGSGRDYLKLTEDQLRKSGAKFHNLLMGKPIYDLFIDDKNVNSETYFGS
tara:strand:- start:1632 stop:1928 length:297 start_codon:yes stop_codon:yes gene_type:complete